MKTYFIINTINDFNFLYPLIQYYISERKKIYIIIIIENLRKENRLILDNKFLFKIKNYLKENKLSDKIMLFEKRNNFYKSFTNVKGNIITLTTNFKIIIKTIYKTSYQNWFAISYFNEDNDILDFVDILFLTSKFDIANLEKKNKVYLGNPYLDLLYKNLKKKNLRNKNKIILFPEIIEDKEWFNRINKYVRNNYNENYTYIFKLRTKTNKHEIIKNKFIQSFSDRNNCFFYDSPFFDITIYLLNLVDEIIITERKTLFIVESLFVKNKINILNNEKINYFKSKPNNLYYENINLNLEDIFEINNSKKVFDKITNYKKNIILSIFFVFLSKFKITKKLVFKYRKNL